VKVSKVYPLIADPSTKRVPVMMQNIAGGLAGLGSSPRGGYQLPIIRALNGLKGR